MNHVRSFSRCPRCAKLGKDNAHDNLASYSDGSCYCFACSYFEAGDKTTAFRKQVERNDAVAERPVSVTLPADVEGTYPRRAIDWIEQYELSRNDLLKHNVLWSEEWQRLIFPYFIEGNLDAWQGRYFGNDPKAPKWFSKAHRGELPSCVYFLGEKSREVVLVEDIVSAIKVSRFEQTAPIFRSVIGVRNWAKLTKHVDHVILWLDPDKRREAVNEAKTGRMFGIDTRVVTTQLDPKEVPYTELEQRLAAIYRERPEGGRV